MSGRNLDIYRKIRKDMPPPGKIIQPKNRRLQDEEDDREIDQWKGWRGEPLEDDEE